MKIHFIGIGGIGISALARYFLARGEEVSGSDCAESPILDELRKLGVRVNANHLTPALSSVKERGSHGALRSTEERGEKVDLVIYSAAVQNDNPELVEARRLGIKCQKYAAALGDLTREKFTIAVSGMHGKSTTTAMIGLIMEKAGLDPTVILGTKVREWNNSNFRSGKSKYLVIEADEYDRSFLNYWPKILVLLNIEEEHLDTYTGGLADIMNTFTEYVARLPENGVLIINSEDKNTNELINPKLEFKIPALRVVTRRVKKYNSENINGLKLKIPGRHNLSNANAALAVARVLGVDEKIAIDALNEFSGTWRRMEYKGEINGAKIYDDYGHHPTEIIATLQGARELPENNGKLYCVFQPHQYQRTYRLFDKFLNTFDAADNVLILPIYSVAGRESGEIKKRVSSEKLVQAINKQQSIINNKKEVLYIDDFSKAAEYIKENLKSGDICVIMGAGDVYKISEMLFRR